MIDKIHVVRREEHHYLPSCPCTDCVEERQRRDQKQEPHTVIRLSPRQAYLLGFIPPLTRSGSLARELSQRHSKSS